MAKKRQRKKPYSKQYQRRLNVAYQKKRSIAGKKAGAKLKGRTQSRAVKHKLKLYRGLVKDYIEKQEEKGNKISYNKARQSDEMKTIVRELKSKDPFIKLQALKKTTRRDGIADSVPVGETAAFMGTGE